MIFKKRRQKISLDIDLEMNGTVIEKVSKTKFLGVMIDEHLTFAPHVQYMKGKISKSLGILYKCKKIFNQDTLLTLYNSFIYPYFTYCITIWGSTFETYLDPIEKLQKRAIRIVAGADRLAHTEPLMAKYKLLSLWKVYIYSVQIFMFRYRRGLLPSVFSDFYIRNSVMHNYGTKRINNFRTPAFKVTPRVRSIRRAGVYCYNYFNDKIEMFVNVSIHSYKKNLKSYVLQNDVSKIIPDPKDA